MISCAQPDYYTLVQYLNVHKKFLIWKFLTVYYMYLYIQLTILDQVGKNPL